MPPYEQESPAWCFVFALSSIAEKGASKQSSLVMNNKTKATKAEEVKVNLLLAVIVRVRLRATLMLGFRLQRPPL